MHDPWVVAVPLGLLIGAVLFGRSKPKWRPFAGVFRHDKRTGQVTVAVTLPSRKRRKSKARRKR